MRLYVNRYFFLHTPPPLATTPFAPLVLPSIVYTYVPSTRYTSPVCATAGAFSDFAWLAERIVDHELPVWLCHAADDPVVNYNSTYQLIHELNMRGYGKMRTTVYPNNTVFWPSAHFSWTATYANPVILDWVMAQTR